MLEERHLDLNEEEDTRMDDTRDDYWSDFVEDGKDKKNIYALRWEVYKIEKEGLIERYFLVSVPHLKGGTLFELV